MKHTYIVEAEFEADLKVHFNALDRYCADSDFEGWLRGVWKHREMSEAEDKLIDEVWEYWHGTRRDIGDEQ